MGEQARRTKNERQSLLSRRPQGNRQLTRDPIPAHFVAGRAVSDHLGRARYRGWTFSGVCVRGAEDVVEVIAFHAGGADGKDLVREPASGSWKIPSDASADEVRAILLAAVVAIDGPGASEAFGWK